MRRKNSRCRAIAGLPLAALAALILSPLSSPAATTYNFTGTGSVDTAISSGWANWKGTFVGQVILDVVGIPTDTGSNYASGEGWVISTFVIIGTKAVTKAGRSSERTIVQIWHWPRTTPEDGILCTQSSLL